MQNLLHNDAMKNLNRHLRTPLQEKKKQKNKSSWPASVAQR